MVVQIIWLILLILDAALTPVCSLTPVVLKLHLFLANLFLYTYTLYICVVLLSSVLPTPLYRGQLCVHYVLSYGLNRTNQALNSDCKPAPSSLLFLASN